MGQALGVDVVRAARLAGKVSATWNRCGPWGRVRGGALKEQVRTLAAGAGTYQSWKQAHQLEVGLGEQCGLHAFHTAGTAGASATWDSCAGITGARSGQRR